MPENAKRERVTNVIHANDKFNPLHALTDDKAERAVIGCVFYQPELFASLSAICQAGDFYSKKHGLIWWAFEQVYPAIDTHTVMRALQTHLTEPGDKLAHELDTFVMDVPDINNAEEYARMVYRSSVLIRMYESGGQISQRVAEGGDLDALIDDCNRLLFTASNQRNGSYETSAQHIVGRYLDKIERIQAGEWTPVVNTGHPRLDNLTGGLGIGEVTVLAGGAGMGKTTLGLCTALNVCKRDERAVIFSLEMSQEEVTDALASIMTGIPPVYIKRKVFATDEQFEWYIKTLGDIALLKLDIIDEFPALSPIQLRRKLRTLEHEGGPINLCMIDGLWLMEASEPSGKDWLDIHHIMRDLTTIASVKEFSVPILLLHQYTGDVKNRGDKTPRITDMAGGRAVERTAQNIWAMYSDNYYGLDDEMGITELHLLKNRMSGGRNESVNFLFKNRRYVEA